MGVSDNKYRPIYYWNN